MRLIDGWSFRRFLRTTFHRFCAVQLIEAGIATVREVLVVNPPIGYTTRSNTLMTKGQFIICGWRFPQLAGKCRCRYRMRFVARPASHSTDIPEAWESPLGPAKQPIVGDVAHRQPPVG